MFEAVLLEEDASVEQRERRQLDRSLAATAVVVVAFTILASVWGSGITPPSADDSIRSDGYPHLWDRHAADFETNGTWSRVLQDGPYSMLENSNPWNATPVMVEFDLPLSEGGSAPNGKVSIAYWRPAVPEGVTVPVILEFGPYFKEQSVGTGPIDEPGTWLGTMILEELLPHGFAFAQASVSGTGDSNHCMDLMGNAEQLGIDAAVTWLGEQEWSNGKIGMIGKSYDGSTPWQAAMFGNPHLETIVPISGLIGVMDLMWKNGSSEARAPIMHNIVYGSYGIDGDSEDNGNMCPDYFLGPAAGGSAYAFGGEAVGSYWEERHFLTRVLANYEGSVYLIQGFHDWNVDPHMAIPVINQLYDAGIEAKGLFGQWDHDYPDRPDYQFDRSDPGRGREGFPNMSRMDWMQDLLEWFNYYLKDEGPQPVLAVEVQNNRGAWHLEARYPMEDTVPFELELGSAGLTRISGGSQILPDASSGPVYETLPLEDDLWFGGLPTLHVNVRTSTYGGQIYALMEDCDANGDCMHIGHAIMDLRYHEGGTAQQSWVPVVETINAKMEFFGMDVLVPADHTIRLTLRSTGEDYLPASTSSIITVEDGGSLLTLDTFDPAYGPEAAHRLYDTVLCTHAICGEP